VPQRKATKVPESLPQTRPAMEIRANAKSRVVPLVSLVSLLLLTANTVAFAQAFDPAQILRHPQSYDGKRLTASGIVRHVLAQTTRQGKDYTTFDLCDDACIKVFVSGHPRLHENQRQSVSGRFVTMKHVDALRVENVLETGEGSIR
jgi:cytochrome c-type biogenesis protein CcmE